MHIIAYIGRDGISRYIVLSVKRIPACQAGRVTGKPFTSLLITEEQTGFDEIWQRSVASPEELGTMESVPDQNRSYDGAGPESGPCPVLPRSSRVPGHSQPAGRRRSAGQWSLRACLNQS